MTFEPVNNDRLTSTELEICAIASGSNGNCYYIGNSEDAIIIDAGISKKKLITRMIEKDLDASKIRAIFITHEHSDHYKGARAISNYLNIPVYINESTFNKCSKKLRPHNVKYINSNEITDICNFKVHSFLKSHDAIEPTSYRVEYKSVNIGVFTDIGYVCDKLKENILLCDAIFLESNYDDNMLSNGNYPYYLKERVASDKGHLSNSQAKEILSLCNPQRVQKVILSHISEDNNSTQVIEEEYKSIEHIYNISLSSRYAPSDVFVIK